MEGSSDEKTDQELYYSQQYVKKYQPFKFLLYTLLGALAILFIALSFSLLYAKTTGDLSSLQLPAIFHANTVIILMSSAAMYHAVRSLKQDDVIQYRWGLGVTFGLGLAFIGFQFLGWRELFQMGYSFVKSPSGSYLYLISGIHALHIVAGLIALGIFFGKALYQQKDPVQELLFLSDPAQPTKVGLLSTYWHFVDGLWLYLYCFFLLVL
ncbi:MAG: cytochrome c oxidase subunit III [Bacteroidetes bacterium SW_11_45_7]|nr:MAG: cytochrome c oxidase subunit III [Bacteroidetes bacterium SW_11_45_7]